MAPTRWGIVSAGLISSDFTTALLMLPREDHKVIAIAAQALSRAEKFAKNFDIPKAYGSYKELADNPDIDVIYVGSIHPAHFEICVLMINAGKNVLCEKPLTMNTHQTKTLTSLAKDKGVFLMEGVWSRFFPIYQNMRDMIKLGEIGEIRMAQANFGFLRTHMKRLTVKEFGGGIALNLGIYTIQFALLVFGEYPQKIVANGYLNGDGVDEAGFVTLHFSNNRVAQLNFHASVTLDQTAYVHGTRGMIKLPNLWTPDYLVAGDKEFNHPLPKPPKQMNYIRSEGFIYEAEAVRQSILKGEKENPLMTHQDSINISRILDEIRRQIGVVYKEDIES